MDLPAHTTTLTSRVQKRLTHWLGFSNHKNSRFFLPGKETTRISVVEEGSSPWSVSTWPETSCWGVGGGWTAPYVNKLSIKRRLVTASMIRFLRFSSR